MTADDRTKVKTTLVAEIPKGRTLNDFNNVVLNALWKYVNETDSSWIGIGVKSVKTELSSERSPPQSI